MSNSMILGAILLLASAAHGADSEPLTIYGIRMLEAVAIPECAAFADPAQWRRKHRTTAYPYSPSTATTCYKRDDRSKSGTAAPLTFETLEILFPTGSEPALAYGVEALAIDGRVEAVKWFTRGAAQQEAVFASLKEKFGEPTAYTLDTKQNGFGAQYKSIRASWSLPQSVTVVFEGVGGQVNQGSVAVMSEAARARVSREMSQGDSRTRM